MPYQMDCPCGHKWEARNIVELIQEFATPSGRFKCPRCGEETASIHMESNLQEKVETWERWVLGVVPVQTDDPTFCPYVFLTAQNRNGPVDGIHFGCRKDTRKSGTGLKHGPGPDCATVLTPVELLSLVRKLEQIDVFPTSHRDRKRSVCP